MSYIALDFDTEMKAATESSDKEKTYALPDGNIDFEHFLQFKVDNITKKSTTTRSTSRSSSRSRQQGSLQGLHPEEAVQDHFKKQFDITKTPPEELQRIRTTPFRQSMQMANAINPITCRSAGLLVC